MRPCTEGTPRNKGELRVGNRDRKPEEPPWGTQERPVRNPRNKGGKRDEKGRKKDRGKGGNPEGRAEEKSRGQLFIY